MDPLVSVIVPAYNIEDYIEKCISSIVGQTCRQIEIILVDDGSTDGTADICGMWQRRDSRIRVIYKENGGLVSARKAGLAAARGEFVLHADGDDWIESGMVESLLHIALSQTADIVTSGFFSGDGITEKPELDTLPEGLYTAKDEPEQRRNFFSRFILNGASVRWGLLPGVCFKLFRTNLLKKVQPYLDNRVLIGEDSAVTYGCCMKAGRIAVTHNAYYHYIVRSSSATHTRPNAYMAGQELLHNFLNDQAYVNTYYNKIKSKIDMYATRQILLGLSNYTAIDPENTIPYFRFRDARIPQGAGIVLYGAGSVGQAYYQQIKAECDYSVVAWIDKAYTDYREKGFPVGPVNGIEGLSYDYIVVAVKRETMAEDIKRQLVNDWGVDAGKIIWPEPGSYLDQFIQM